MKNLPVLAGGRGALVGTYFAEQVSGGCYDLVSVSHAEQQRRPVTSQQSGGTRNAAPATPGSARGRRRHLQEQDGVKCTILPALENVESLLSEDTEVFGASKGGKNGKDDATEDMSNDLDRRTLRENNLVAQAERIKQTSTRLWRGARPNREGAPCGTGDEDFLASLTRPLGFLNKLEAPQSRKKESSRGSEKKFKKKHKTYSELFRTGLAGTELEAIPLHQQRGPASHKFSLAKDRAIGLNLRPNEDVRVIPKDAVESYFKAEMAIAEVRQLRGHEDIHSLHEKVRKQAFVMSGARPPGFRVPPLEARKGGASDVEAPEEMLFLTSEGSTAAAPGTTAAASACECGNIYMEGDKFCRACGTKRPQLPVEAAVPVESAKGVEVCEDAANDEGANTARAADPEVLEAVSKNAKLGALRREACQLIRFFFFGNIGNETRKGTKEKEKVYYDTVGSREQVKALFNIWDRMDSDNTNRVEFQEFRVFVERSATDRGQGHERRNSLSGAPEKKEAIFSFFQSNSQEDNLKFAGKLIEKVASVLMSKKSFFVLEDMMRLIWPCSSFEDLKKMRQWCEEFSLTNAKWRVPTPKVLSASEFEALSAVFKYFDKDGSGTVTAEELVHSGLLDREQASRYMAEILTDAGGEMTLNEFCEMMCPNGYRAALTSMIGTDDAGRRVVLDEKLGGWRREEDRNVRDAWSG